MLMQIRNRQHTLNLVGLLLLLATAGTTWAKTLATNTLTIAESLTEKVACTKNLATKAWACDLVAGDSYTISATVLLTGVNISTFTGATTFNLSVGNLHISHPLSFDPKYAPGKTSATFISSYTDSKNKKIVYQTVALKWTAALLTVTITGKTADTTSPGWASIQADTFSNDDSHAFTETTTGSISLGSTRINYNAVPLGGTVTRKAVKGKDNTIYQTATVKILKGTAFGVVAPPAITGIQVTLGSATPATNATFGTQGGSFSFSNGPLSGVSLTVPVGALTSNRHLTVSHRSATLTPRSGTFSGHVIDIQTDGSRSFSEPVQLTVPYVPNGQTIPVPYYIDTNGHLLACQVIGIDRQAGTLTFESWHASPFTWLMAQLGGAEEAHTSYLAPADGFQVNNAAYSTPYNRSGNCFGMCAFELWYFTEKGGGLYPKYMESLTVPGYAPIKGQDCIATRAHNSVNQVYQHYWERKAAQFSLTAEERVAFIKNVIANTGAPTILSGRSEPNGHAFLATDCFLNGPTNTLWINDPNIPGQHTEITYIAGSSNLAYNTSYGYIFTNITVMGNGSWQFEPFDSIYADAEDGFHGSGAAQVNVLSHTNLQQVTDRTVNLSGVVSNGQVAVSVLRVNNNGIKYQGNVDLHGNFNIPISIVAGTNQLTFQTYGWVNTWVGGLPVNDVVEVLNTQKQPFNLLYMQTSAVILVTLTWNNNDTDLDLYTIDPTGDYSSYYHYMTASGGTLDHDVTGGYGPEHWTLSGLNTVQWGQDYKVRVHYFSDHQSCTYSSCDPQIPVRPTGWTVTVVVYEETDRMQTFSFSGVLDAADSGNARPPTAGGSDWADVCTITPVKAPGQLRLAATAQQSSSGEIQITVPIPSAEDCLQLKLASPDAQR